MNNIKKEIIDLEDELIALRREFHMYPELGFEEYKTSAIIKEYLTNLGLEVIEMAKTGVVATLKGVKDGKTILLRADMDALPVVEENDVEYKSKNHGVMHACGHDGHMAMLLIAAKILSKKRNKLSGNIKFVFQPNEEDAGAKFMVEEGVLENPKVDASFAIHLWSDIASGKLGVTKGAVMAEQYNFYVDIIGKGGHTSAPHKSIDPIMTAATILCNLQNIQTKGIDPLLPISICVGKISGGSMPNIIPSTTEIQGTVRYLYDKDLYDETPLEKIDRVIKGTTDLCGASYNARYELSNYVVLNDDNFIDFLNNEVVNTIVNSSDIVEYRCLGGEDFSEFSNVNNVPGALVFVGIASESKNSNYPHHHPQFNIDESALRIGVELHIKVAMSYLK